MGICRGIQLLNVACGGTLYQDLGQQRPDSLDHNTETYPKYYISHELELTDGSFLMSVFQQRTIGVNSLHHQGIKTLGQGLTATAFATDGLIEGIELPGKRCVFGVQFHPEMMIDHDPEMRKFFEIFIKQATWQV